MLAWISCPTVVLLSYVLLLFLSTVNARYDIEDLLTQRMLEGMETNARRTNHPNNVPGLSHVRPENRRFLFSPTIQNTITNLNQNQNTNLQDGKESVESRGVYSYRNPMTGALDYDLRGMRPRKICFTFD